MYRLLPILRINELTVLLCEFILPYVLYSLRRKGKGQPVNDLDQACKDLHHGYNCIKIDDSECNPRTLDASQNEYTLPLTAISPLVDPDQACQDANPGDTCGYRTCLVEAQFLITTYQPVYAGNQTWIDMWNDMTFVHQPDGGFDFENQCIGRPGIGPAGDKQCCGQYPYRNAYFTARKQCCNDVISPIGAC